MFIAASYVPTPGRGGSGFSVPAQTQTLSKVLQVLKLCSEGSVCVCVCVTPVLGTQDVCALIVVVHRWPVRSAMRDVGYAPTAFLRLGCETPLPDGLPFLLFLLRDNFDFSIRNSVS